MLTKLSVSKSDLIKQLKKIYPNLLKKDLLKIFDQFLNEIKIALKNSERVEIRNSMIFYTSIQKERMSRNPATGQSVLSLKKKIVRFKMGKDLIKVINEK